MKVIGVIPARYKSSRFPGKPLADIHGYPMVWWVYNNASKARLLDEVYVATDDERIENVCKHYSIPVCMTSDKHPTGTDRVAEVARKIKADLYVNIQGDEPMLGPDIINIAVEPFLSGVIIDFKVTNLMTTITGVSELINSTVPKVVTNSQGYGIFLSRSPIPFPKGEIDIDYKKQVCVYGFLPEALDLFANTQRGFIEKCEDIEILRFIENGIKVKFIDVHYESVAVDTEKDLVKVRKLMPPSLGDNK